MFRINRQTDYAIRIILCLSKAKAGSRLSSKDIQQNMLIPKTLNPRIVAELARAGFIYTYPGRDGGVELSIPSEEITLWDIVDLFEGPLHISECLLHGQECSFEEGCSVRLRWKALHNVIRQELQKVSFSDLARDEQEMEVFVST